MARWTSSRSSTLFSPWSTALRSRRCTTCGGCWICARGARSASSKYTTSSATSGLVSLSLPLLLMSEVPLSLYYYERGTSCYERGTPAPILTCARGARLASSKYTSATFGPAVERIGTNKPVTARFWPWLEPFSVRNSCPSFYVVLDLCKRGATGVFEIHYFFRHIWSRCRANRNKQSRHGQFLALA